MMYVGIDAGSRAVKAVVWNAGARQVAARACVDQGVRQEAIARNLLGELFLAEGISQQDVGGTVATGYARGLVEADTTITEITCHARGVREVLPAARTVVEIGGQDSKLLKLTETGTVRDFAMNDRCAAGTGRFLEMVAQRLEVGLEDLGVLAGRSAEPAKISSMCVVFAETEIIGLLARGTPPEDIVAGVQEAIAQRVTNMAGLRLDSPVAFTGGVALVPGMERALAEALAEQVMIAPDPQFTGALGAALLAAERGDR